MSAHLTKYLSECPVILNYYVARLHQLQTVHFYILHFGPNFPIKTVSTNYLAVLSAVSNYFYPVSMCEHEISVFSYLWAVEEAASLRHTLLIFYQSSVAAAEEESRWSDRSATQQTRSDLLLFPTLDRGSLSLRRQGMEGWSTPTPLRKIFLLFSLLLLLFLRLFCTSILARRWSCGLDADSDARQNCGVCGPVGPQYLPNR